MNSLLKVLILVIAGLPLAAAFAGFTPAHTAPRGPESLVNMSPAITAEKAVKTGGASLPAEASPLREQETTAAGHDGTTTGEEKSKTDFSWLRKIIDMPLMLYRGSDEEVEISYGKILKR